MSISRVWLVTSQRKAQASRASAVLCLIPQATKTPAGGLLATSRRPSFAGDVAAESPSIMSYGWVLLSGHEKPKHQKHQPSFALCPKQRKAPARLFGDAATGNASIMSVGFSFYTHKQPKHHERSPGFALLPKQRFCW